QMLTDSRQSWQKSMNIGRTILLWIFVLVSTSAWSNVFVQWTGGAIPPATELGMNDLVLSWNDSFLAQAKEARKQGNPVYVGTPFNQAQTPPETVAHRSGLERRGRRHSQCSPV